MLFKSDKSGVGPKNQADASSLTNHRTVNSPSSQQTNIQATSHLKVAMP
ncbi:hypothetical protein N9B22_00305 [bacterium]|nr:hypothetical protein [bacterium]